MYPLTVRAAANAAIASARPAAAKPAPGQSSGRGYDQRDTGVHQSSSAIWEPFDIIKL